MKKRLGLVLTAALLLSLVSAGAIARNSNVSVHVSDSTFAAQEAAVVSGPGTDLSSSTVKNGGGGGKSLDLWVHAQCFRGGEQVLEQWRRVYSGVATLTLGPTAKWQSGDADCTAEAGYFGKTRFKSLDETTFHVSG